ncbi:transporter [Pseudomonas sp. UL073]|uniref:Transporter n=1 Tax=Zestomonas insulae TaxID=2809017 RepID=A0ABS2IJ09_9GAMM|nr:transporter [Pseudomonas insulae]MBM7061833.1 transporter [Pseudomonas insulae]
MPRPNISLSCSLLLAVGLHGNLAMADDAELAKKLSNPVASLISVPFQLNYDEKLGPQGHGKRYQLNFQPVVPISLNEDWNLISRTILPLIHQDEVVPNQGNRSGTGDITQSLFFSPKAPSESGYIWGVGPAFLLPTASDDSLGTEKWAAGPTAVVLKQQGEWTLGALANHLWDYAGDGNRAPVDATFIQPFVAYTTPTAWTYTLNSEATYDWEAEQWAVPLNAQITKLLKFGKQPVSVGGGVRYWAEHADNGPEGWGARMVVVFLFPK